VREDRPHHAYLLLGPEGLGKMSLARLLAQGLVCEELAAAPCGECTSCRKVHGNNHADVWTESPSGKSQTIVVDQIQELQRRLSYRRLEGRHRVVLIERADRLNDAAQNKLLKTLEEPPPATVLVLCALHPAQLLATVRSRCSKLSLSRVATGEIADWLVQQHGASPQRAQQAASAAQGLPGRAVELLDGEGLELRQEQLESLLAALAGEREAIDRVAEAARGDREIAAASLSMIQELLRDAMSSAAGSDVSALHPQARPYSGRLALLDARQLADRIARVELARSKLQRNVQAVGVLEDLLVYLGAEQPQP